MSTSYQQLPLFLTAKTCRRCEEVLPLTCFGKHARKKDGLRAWCRACVAISSRQWYAANRERAAAHSKKYKRDFAARVAEGQARWHQHKKATDPTYLEKNKVRSAKWRESHEDAFRIWSAPRLESLYARHRAWTRANPDKCNEATRRRDARKRAVFVEKVDYKAILARDGCWCHICQSAVDPCDVAYDHVIPLSKGGPHSMANIKVSHRTCNRRKHARLDRWLR